MQKLLIDIVESDIPKMIAGLEKLKEDFNDRRFPGRYNELPFVQSGDEYLINLRLDRKTKILER